MKKPRFVAAKIAAACSAAMLFSTAAFATCCLIPHLVEGGSFINSDGQQQLANGTITGSRGLNLDSPIITGYVSYGSSSGSVGASGGSAGDRGGRGGGGQPPPPPPPAPPPPPKDKPPSDNNTSTCGSGDSGNPSIGQPVIVATGEKLKSEQDIVSGSSYGLGLQRTYRSLGTTAVMFGPKWSSEYDYPKLQFLGCWYDPDYSTTICLPQRIKFTLPDGSTYTWFTNGKDVSGYRFVATNAAASMGTFIYSPTSDVVLTMNKTKYTFWNTGTLKGAIKSVATIGGATLLNFTYTSGRLTSVSNTAGQLLQFTWNTASAPYRVATVTDPANNVWTYTYTADANKMVASVTSPGPSADVRTYHYEHPGNGTLLTGISINGVRHSTYSYQADGRVQVSGLAGGEERDTFSYGTNTTTVTSAAGQPVTYTFTTGPNAALKLSSVSRAPTSTCAQAAAQTFYDGNGWVDYALDWNNNRTEYSYDSTGKLLIATTAAGTASANTRENVWSGTDIASTTYRDAGGAAYGGV